jgi:predicted permease
MFAWIKVLASRIGGWLGRKRVEQEFGDELGTHLELLAQENMRRGMTREEAERTARIRLGGATQLREINREQRGLPLLETLLQDLRFALRGLRKNPGFALICILTLALGIGANTAIFSVVNAVLLQQLPFPDPGRVVVLSRHEASSIPYPEFLDLQEQAKSFELLALQRRDSMNLTSAGEPEMVLVRMCSADFLPILGLQPILGRLYTKEEDRLGAAPVVLLSESLWRKRFNAAPNAVGSSASMDGKDYTIIGVVPDLPRQFSKSDLFMPIGQWDEPSFRIRGYGLGARGLARLKPGVTLEQARADMHHVAGNLAAAYPKDDSELVFSAVPFRTFSVGDLQRTLLLLFGAVGFVLLIACANVANLLLARATSRKRELAIRVTMGAGRGRVVRQLLTETSVLAILGGSLGLLLALWGTRAMIAAAPAELLNTEVPGTNLRVLFFTFALSLLTGILFGIVPAWKAARVNVQETLKEGGRGSTSSHQRAQSVLVVSELALAVVLLVGAGLLIRSLARIWQVDPGFDPHNVLTFDVVPSPEAAANDATNRQNYTRLVEGLEALPGVEGASIVFGNLPFTGDSDVEFWREDRPQPEKMADAPDAMYYGVAPDYLRMMRIPLLKGRFVANEDTEKAPVIVVINDAIARKIFPDEDPLGKHLYISFFNESAEIVGIAASVKHSGLDTPPENDNPFQIYLSFRQVPDRLMAIFAKGSSVAVRTAGSPALIAAGVRQVLRAIDSRQVMFNEGSLENYLAVSLAPRRFSLVMMGVFAALALLLASIGIYGVISNLVGQSTHEFGVRMALGAQPRDVLRLVLGRGVRLDLVGVGVGVLVALPLMQLLARQLFGVTATDPLTFAGVALLLSAVALLACFIPAFRATRVDPLVTLRHD